MMLRLDCCGLLCVLICYAAMIYANYAIVFWMILPTLYESFWGPLHVVAFNSLLCLAFLAHLRTMTSDPGIVPITKEVERTNKHKYYPPEEESDEDSDIELFSRSKHYVGEDWTICVKCASYRPPRAHHCRVCKRCVRRMDHHCPWVNNCVGEMNQKFFLQFVLYVGILSIYAIVIIILSWLYHDENSTTGSHGPAGEIARHYKVIHTVALSIECSLFGLFVLAVSCDQLQAIFNDETIIEALQRRSNLRRRQLQASKYALLANVCGPNTHWLLWGLPCISSLKSRTEIVRFARNLKDDSNVRICIVCGKLSLISCSVLYPKGKNRRKEFDTALNLSSYVSDALPVGSYICGKHFNPNELELSTGTGPAQISDTAIPSLDLDHEFLKELCLLKKEELEPKKAVHLVKSKLDWDTKPPLLVEQENYESDESKESNTPNALVSSLFGKTGFNKPLKHSLKRDSNSPHSPPNKSVRLVPVTAKNRPTSQTPPVLEKMSETNDDDQPPTLSPVVRKSQRTKMPILEASSSSPLAALSNTPSTSKAIPTETDKKDQLIQKLRQSLAEKSTELSLLKKKLEITEELLQFYQNNHKSNEYEHEVEDLPPLLSLGQNSFHVEEQLSNGSSGQATAMVTEGNQSELLQQLLKGDTSDY
ncbi:DHHC zinc finger domain containing protein [Aphelenchoides bicaudatus]|nr:DHHC zinc finger domain containing protein [Aphelenchoides bicaudatus]